jgi:acyl carrier protein
MGLDTVELIVSFEKHFGVEITDSAAGSIRTVGDMAAWLGQQLGTIGRRESAVRETVAQQLRTFFELPATLATAETEVTPLLALLPNHAAWKHYAAELRAQYRLVSPQLPVVAPAPPLGWLARLFGSDQLPPRPTLSNSTLGELIDWTVALNYEKLLSPPYSSQYDVEQAVIGLTCDKSGVEIEEIRLSSSFTNDLGMD